MTRREKLEEQYEDAYFALLMDAVAEKEGARLEELNDQLNRDPTAAVPEEIDRRCRKVINRHFAEQRRSGYWRTTKRVLNRAAIVAAVMMLLFTSAFALSEDFRISALNLLITVEEQYTQLEMKSDDPSEDLKSLPTTSEGLATSEYFENLEIGWIPEGFSCVDSTFNHYGVTRVVQPIDTTVIRSYGPIKGVVLDRIATGVTSSKTVGGSISVDSGELIGGFSISAEVSVEASMEATGPEEGARLANGAKVTHRIISGILFGVMVRTTYADIDPWTGAQLGDPYYEYTIIDEDGIAYSHLAHIASPTYVEKATDSSYVTDNNYQDFKEHLASYPGDFI